MILIQQYIYKCKNTNAGGTGGSIVQVRMRFLTSEFSSSSRGERHKTYNANPI